MKKLSFLLLLSSLAFAGNTNTNLPTITVTFTQSSTPANPPTGTNRCYVKSDNNFYCLTSGGTETQIGGLSSTLASGDIIVGNGSNLATAVAMSGDVAITNAGATTVGTVGGSTAANIHTAEGLVNGSQSGSKFFASPSGGGSGAPTYRAIVAGDVPTLNQNTTGTATNATNGATVSTTVNASFFPLFAASSTNGNQPFNLGTGLTFNPSTNALTTTTFVGALTGTASGNLQATPSAHGTLISGSGNTANVTATGTAGYVLTSNGASADPTYQVQASAPVFVPPAIQTFTATGAGTFNEPYAFIISSATIGAGCVYTNNSVTYTTLNAVTSATLVYMTGSSTPASSGTLTYVSGGAGCSGAANVTFSSYKAPLYLEVRAVGGGGGGGGSNSSGGTGGTGGNTTFGTSLIAANGGVGGTGGSTNSTGGSGGTATITASSTVIQIAAVSGGSGQAGLAEASYSSGYVVYGAGGMGGSSAFGGGGYSSSIGNAGGPGATNTGGGGGGGGVSSAANAGAGGGSGGYGEALLMSPSATYGFSVGTGGSAGTGTGGASGGAGGSGIVITKASYQ